VGAQKKAWQWTEDSEVDVEEINKSTKLQKNQTTSQKLQGNNRQIQNKYRAKGTARQKKLQGNKSKIGKSKYKQRKQSKGRL
jgi:hypothetical protein